MNHSETPVSPEIQQWLTDFLLPSDSRDNKLLNLAASLSSSKCSWSVFDIRQDKTTYYSLKTQTSQKELMLKAQSCITQTFSNDYLAWNLLRQMQTNSLLRTSFPRQDLKTSIAISSMLRDDCGCRSGVWGAALSPALSSLTLSACQTLHQDIQTSGFLPPAHLWLTVTHGGGQGAGGRRGGGEEGKEETRSGC